MKFDSPICIKEIAKIANAEIIGNESGLVTGINEIHKVEVGDITFVDFKKYFSKALNSDADFILINERLEAPKGKTLLVCSAPFDAYVSIVKKFRTFEPSKELLSHSSFIDEGTHLQPGVFVGNHVRIGKNCLIHPNVTIYDHTEIGNNVIIHAGAVIGADAFYYKRKPTSAVQYHKMESCGRVIIHDNVEIGAGTTIDKGVSGDTIIGMGTKIDNHVHIGHGAVIGKNCLFAAQVGIGGKAIIEDEVILWGQVGVSKDLTIGKGAVVYAQSGVASSIEGGKIYFGSPADDAKTKMRELGWIKRIPELWKKIKQ